jgi:prophage regulatory protein
MEILRIKVVQRRTGLGRSTIYDRISKGTFPRQISLGTRAVGAVGWVDSEIDNWLYEQIAISRGVSREPGINSQIFRKPENLTTGTKENDVPQPPDRGQAKVDR